MNTCLYFNLPHDAYKGASVLHTHVSSTFISVYIPNIDITRKMVPIQGEQARSLYFVNAIQG